MSNNEKLDDELIGRTIKQKYRIDKFIGKGGMGKVYKCTNLLLNNEWACKVVPKDYSYAHYFRKEAEILEKINHSNMPKIVDLFEDEENIYIVETYIEGKLLSEKIIEKGRLSNEETIDYFMQLALLIEYLHNVKPLPIIYRDIKPNNIIISHNNRLVLIDFSIAKLHDENKIEDTIIAGNKYYSSPEQLVLDKKSDMRSDIYSLGMIALRMITGKLKENVSVYEMDEYTEINPELREIIEKCIYENREMRYQDVSELVRDLTILKEEQTMSTIKEKKIILVDGMSSSGKTFIATKLAIKYALMKVKVSYIDLTNELGCAEYFDVKLDNNLGPLLKENKIEEIKKKSYKCKKYLDVYKGEVNNEKQIINFARKLIKFNDIVIIDNNLKETNSLYDYVDEILLCMTQDEKIENLTNKKIVDYVDKELDLKTIKIILNKYENDFKKASDVLSDINIIPKIFKAPTEFREIYKVPELKRADLLKITKNKVIALDDNDVDKSISNIANKIFNIHLFELPKDFQKNMTWNDSKLLYQFLKTEIKKMFGKKVNEAI